MFYVRLLRARGNRARCRRDWRGRLVVRIHLVRCYYDLALPANVTFFERLLSDVHGACFADKRLDLSCKKDHEFTGASHEESEARYKGCIAAVKTVVWSGVNQREKNCRDEDMLVKSSIVRESLQAIYDVTVDADGEKELLPAICRLRGACVFDTDVYTSYGEDAGFDVKYDDAGYNDDDSDSESDSDALGHISDPADWWQAVPAAVELLASSTTLSSSSSSSSSLSLSSLSSSSSSLLDALPPRAWSPSVCNQMRSLRRESILIGSGCFEHIRLFSPIIFDAEGVHALRMHCVNRFGAADDDDRNDNDDDNDDADAAYCKLVAASSSSTSLKTCDDDRDERIMTAAANDTLTFEDAVALHNANRQQRHSDGNDTATMVPWAVALKGSETVVIPPYWKLTHEGSRNRASSYHFINANVTRLQLQRTIRHSAALPY
jgi:hypothetical protein